MKGVERIIPPLFRCPISLDLFTDPVTLCTGQTYERSSIEKWLACGNLICPVTMQKLHDPSTVPNHTLRHLIDGWLQSGNQVEPDCLKMIDNDDSIAAIKHILESNESMLDHKLQILEKIRVLSEELPLQNSLLIQLDFFKLLLELVFRNAEGLNFQENLRVVEKALICARNLLPFGDLGCLNILKEESKLAQFIFLLEKGSIIIKKCLCHMVEAISSDLETQQLCSTLGKSDELVQEIVHLLHNNSDAVEDGTKSISALALSESSRENLVKQGAIQGLIIYIFNAKKQEKSLAPMAMETILKLLLSVESAKQAVINHPLGIDAIVKMVFRVSSHHEGSESAVNSLLIICFESKSVGEEAIGAGVLTQLLLLLQSQCSGRTKTKARMLLKLLGSMWTENPKVSF
ncbi:U-box domain-containing protein 26 [Forsythia ovata]|uniref:U-box domain-containing protein n=1 Tax=Forsythia ovata TaxID=205694 RepID=A0ABD1UT49_9LAMI